VVTPRPLRRSASVPRRYYSSSAPMHCAVVATGRAHFFRYRGLAPPRVVLGRPASRNTATSANVSLLREAPAGPLTWPRTLFMVVLQGPGLWLSTCPATTTRNRAAAVGVGLGAWGRIVISLHAAPGPSFLLISGGPAETLLVDLSPGSAAGVVVIESCGLPASLTRSGSASPHELLRQQDLGSVTPLACWTLLSTSRETDETSGSYTLIEAWTSNTTIAPAFDWRTLLRFTKPR
jgi:hypothetical protein